MAKRFKKRGGGQGGKAATDRRQKFPQKQARPQPAPAQKAQAPGRGEEKKIPARIVSLSRNFAFARPDDGGEDVFVHGDRLNGAFLGDQVLLTNLIQQERGPSGEVAQVVQEAPRLLTGTVELGSFGWEFHASAAIRYGLPLAGNSLRQLHNGDKVQAEIQKSGRDYAALVVKRYGSGDSARICADAIIDEYQIRREFPPEVKEEAALLANRRVTEEEEQLLAGGQVDKSLYSSSPSFLIDSEKLLAKGRLITVRPHTRFAAFPMHTHNYVEIMYMCSGQTVHQIEGRPPLTLQAGELLFLNQHASHGVERAGEEDVGVNFIVLPQFLTMPWP